MAQLTWRDVAAPDFSSANDSYRVMAQLLGNSTDSLSKALGDFQTNRQAEADRANNSAIGAAALGYTDSASLREALRSGTIVGNRQLTPQMLNFLAGRDHDLLQNERAGIGNADASFRLDTARRDDGQAQARLAMQPEAAKLLADARMLASSGDPAKVEQARTMLTDGYRTLVGAGFTADQIPGLLDQERSAGTAGFTYRKDVLENSKFWEQQGISKQAQERAFKEINGNATPDVAIRTIQEDTSIQDPRIKAEAIQMIKQAAEGSVFAQATDADKLLASLGMQYGVPPAAPARANGGSNPLVALLDKVEGGGDFSTLYGHAQRPGGAFEGVDVSKMTIGQLLNFSSPNGPYGRHQKAQLGYVATPMGRFQVVGDTLRKAAQDMGLPMDQVFDAPTQVAVFNHLADKRLSGPRTMQGKMDNLRQEWVGLQHVKDADLAAAITAYENGDRGALAGVAGLSPNSGSAPAAQMPAETPRITLPIGSSPTSPVSEAQQVDRALSDALGGRRVTAPIEEPAQEPMQRPTPSFRETEEEAMAILRRDHRQLQNEIDMTRGQGASEAARLAASAQAAATAGETPVTVTPARPSTPTTSSETPSVVVQGASPAAPAASSPVQSPANAVQDLIDQSTLDRVFNRNSALINEIVNNPNRNETPDQTVSRLIAPDGLLPSGNRQAVLQAINETIAMSGGKLTPSAAGAIVANNAESRDLTSWLPFGWNDGDRFSTKDENMASATRTNMAGVAEDLKQLGMNVDGSIELSRGTSQFRNQRQSTVTAEQLPQIQALLLAASSEAANIAAAIQRGQDTPANRAALQRALQTVQQLQAILDQIGAEPGSPTTIYSGAGEGLPTR